MLFSLTCKEALGLSFCHQTFSQVFILYNQARREAFQFRIREPSTPSAGIDNVTNRQIFVCTTKVDGYSGINGVLGHDNPFMITYKLY